MDKALPKLPNTLGALYKSLTDYLKTGTEPESASLDARMIIEKHTALTYLDMLSDEARDVAANILEQISIDAELRWQGMPLSKLYGVKEFWGRDFKVSQDVLDPRPDTESIIEACLEWGRKEATGANLSIADIGTGSGCILITLLSEMPLAKGVGLDISTKAIKIAQENANLLSVADRGEFLESDLMYAVEHRKFDLIVTNPPYIPSSDIANLSESVKNYDPILALDGGEDGLMPYKRIFISAKKCLRPNGRLFLECGFDQIEAITRIGENTGATLERIIYDLNGYARGGEFSCGDKG